MVRKKQKLIDDNSDLPCTSAEAAMFVGDNSNEREVQSSSQKRLTDEKVQSSLQKRSETHKFAHRDYIIDLDLIDDFDQNILHDDTDTRDDIDSTQENVRNRKRKSRAEMTDSERVEQRANDRARKAEINKNPLFLSAIHSENAKLYELGTFDVKCAHCPAIHFPEEHVETSRKAKTEFSSCCNYGKLTIMENYIDDYPDNMKTLFFDENNSHKNFIENIRRYNSSFACASIACSRFNFSNPGPPCYRIQGQVYHKFNPNAMPENDQELPTNGQLFFIDTNESLKYRMQMHNQCDPTIYSYIETIIRKNYPYANSYKMMNEVYTDEVEKAKINSTEIPEVNLLFSVKKGYDMRRYNLPRTNEVCAIMVTNANDEVLPANIVVHLKGSKELKNIFPLDPNVEPMCYPLFYPNNTKGWNCDMKDKFGYKITLCDFVKYRLHYRDSGKFLPFHFGEKLFQQWVVDNAARIEWDRLNYIRKHQKEICKNSYKNLTDYLEKRTENEGISIKGQVILPPSFVGSARNMHNHFMDSLTIVGEIGKPTIFLTFTCNPYDQDILKCLKKGQTASSRPDIVVRVFKLKIDRLLFEIVNKGIFGTVIGYCWTLEFQKRGLPHLHALFTLQSEYKICTKDKVDNFISAEIPDDRLDPTLYNIVTKLMIHGPCGKDITNSPCWDIKKGRCSKKFPKKFREETLLVEDSYPLYKRPNNGRFVWKKGIKLTNEYVVPFNPYLLKRFHSHINVEPVTDIKVVKYLYKYIYKGYDSATISASVVGPDGEQKMLKYDEIGQYLDARFLSPCEACWRIMKYPLQGKSHSVELLDVHLEGEQTIHFDKDAEDQIIEEQMAKKSTLLAYFDFMHENPNLNFIYTDMPKHCTWISKTKKWKYPRQGHYKALGRLAPVSPRDPEKYHFRLLLQKFPGKSYSDFKTVNGIEYKTFGQACLERGLTQNDDEWKHCLEEASHFKFPSALRNLFSTILLHCAPKDPKNLWNEFKDELSMDFLRKYPKTISYQKALELINKNLILQEKSLNDFPEMPQLNDLEMNKIDDEFIDPSDEFIKANLLINKMNNGQKAIMDEIKKSGNQQKLIYIDGPGGTGKSFTLSAIFHLARSERKKVCNMAFSGIASTLLKKGRTLHNRFKLPLNLNGESTSGIIPNTKIADEIKAIDIFIIDEVSMSPRFAIEIIDKKLKEIMQNDLPFGGKTIVMSGDNRQCSPIKKGAAECEIIDLMFKKSKLWKYFKELKLTENMRADPKEKKFAEDLLTIGEGRDGYEDYMHIPESCIVADSLIDEIYGNIFEKKSFEQLKDVMIVSPFNSIADSYNEEALKKFPGDIVTYYSIDETEYTANFPVPVDILNTFNCPSIPKHKLELKKDCVVILLRNLNVDEGLCNGTRLQVIDPLKHVLRCIILNGDRVGEEVFIPRITLIEEKDVPAILRRHQFPVKLAFAITINKCQGQTFKKIGIDFTRQSFAHGQSYVSVSRVKSWECVKVKLADENIEHKVSNIVWKELL